VVVLRGEGKSFHTGRDTRKMGERKPGVTKYDHLRMGQRNNHALLDMGKPTIAAVQGNALGGGAEFALLCDIRVAADDLKLSLPEVKFALTVDGGGSALAWSLIGPSRAKWLLMTGDAVDAKTALDWGLVDFVVPRAELDAKAMAMATKIAANSPRAVLAAKELADELWSDTIRAATRRELNALLTMYDTEEFIALREKRRQALAAKAVGGAG
jgi:enoyl-CoA hydratase/carnithine racemase